MQKGKYDWKNTNVELIGSSEDRTIKKSSAENEPAWNKAKTCVRPGLFIWRIEKFKIVEWPQMQHGEFYEGDSYILLNIYQKGNRLIYDEHFWIGNYSTQDEYGTAAYKTVELYNLLDGKPVLHREVQQYESELFKSYFENLIYLKGGCESGFRQVTTPDYTPRLLHVRRERRNVIVSEVNATKTNLNSNGVFIYDTGTDIYEWIGKCANKDEKLEAQILAQKLNEDRNGKSKIEIYNEADMTKNHEFYNFFSDLQTDEVDQCEYTLSLKDKKLFRISDVSGSLKFENIATGNFGKKDINEDDVFIIDNGLEVYVYIGEKANYNERLNSLIYAHNYLKPTKYPQVRVTVIKKDVKGENAENFDKFIGE